MNKCFAIAVSVCFVVISVSSVDAGIFGRRGGSCRGGNCYRYSMPTYTASVPTATTKAVVKSSDAEKTETKTSVAKPATTKAPVPVKSVSQPVPSPSNLTVPQAAPTTTYSRVIYSSSPCANGRCYRRR